MSSDTVDVPEQLVEACRTTIGDELRSVVYFTPDGYEQAYLRSDLDAEADLSAFVENERVGFDRQTADLSSELGAHEYAIHGFENGYLTRVIVGDSGAFVTTDELSMRRFEEVVTAVRKVLGAADDR